jgi:peptide/nickel transport system substrate-binding protein
MPVFLADQGGYVIAPEQIDSGETDTAIGTGPFVFEQWQPDVRFRATRNDSYWRDGLPYLDSIEFVPLGDTATRLGAIRSGEVDVLDLVGLDDATDLAGEGFRVVDNTDVASTSVLILNHDAEGTDDLRVREALVRSVDLDMFIEVVLNGDALPADQPYEPDSPWHAPVDYPEFDPERAAELIAEFEADEGELSIEILVINADVLLTATQFLQQSWVTQGVDVTIASVEIGSFITRFIEGDYQAVYLGGFFGSADPDGLSHFLHSDNADGPIALNFPRHRNPEVDAAIEAQRTTDDPAARAESWATVWQALADDLPYLFLAHQRTRTVTAPEVSGYDDLTTPEGVSLPAINRWASFPTAVFISGD